MHFLYGTFWKEIHKYVYRSWLSMKELHSLNNPPGTGPAIIENVPVILAEFSSQNMSSATRYFVI